MYIIKLSSVDVLLREGKKEFVVEKKNNILE